MWYYRASSTSSGSKVPSMFVNIWSESQIGSATGGTIVQYSINPEKQNIWTLLEFLYKKNAIDSYLKIYKSSIDEFSNNDIIQLATLSSRTDVNKLTAEEKKINDLKVLLSTLESEYIDKLYAELWKTSISITNWVTWDDEIYKWILKRYVEKQYIFYSRLVNSWFVISFSSTSLMAQKDLDYDVCKVTQLYWYSLASDGYPNQLHNWYDFVYAKWWSREVTVRSIIDWTVVKSGKLMSANGYYIGNSVLIRWDDIWTDDSWKPVIPYVEYLHLSDWRMAQEWKKVSAWDPVGIQWWTASFPVHLHLSLFLSRQDWECNGALTSARWYSCAVKSDQFFRAIWYENILRNVNASCYEEWKWGWTIGRDW